MLYLLLAFSISTSSNINCADSSCSSCTTGYLYNSLSCLPLCPTGFIQTSSPNTCTASSSQSLFYLNFWEFRQFGVSSIGNFQHPGGLLFDDSQHLTPIPTNERGFYFASTSRLVSTSSYVLGPDLTLRFCIRIKADGTIFEASSGGISYFKLAAVSGTVTAYWYLTSTSGSAGHSLSLYAYQTYWATAVFNSAQASGTFTMNMPGYSTTTISGFEFRGQYSNMLYYFGGVTSGDSFTGFFHEIYVDNSVITEYNLYDPYVLCEYNEYFNAAGQCAACTGCSETWPWCARPGCTVCYSSACTSCTGFGYDFCDSCSTSAVAPDCVLGLHCAAGSRVFSCTSCLSGYSLIDGLCLVLPYAYDSSTLTSPIIDITFSIFEQYYGVAFQSGSNPSTWAPFHTPDTDDPFPVKNRGLYFDGSYKYLITTGNFVLNYKWSVAMWIYPQKYSILLYTSALTIYIGYATIRISNPDDVWSPSSYNFENTYDIWMFSVYAVNFASNTVSMTYTQDETSVSVLSVDGYAFYDPGSLMTIGQYSTYNIQNYQGFIYSITIWQDYVTDLTSHYNICGTGLGSSCIWNCGLTQYYNSYEALYLNCDSSCTDGCAAAGTCTQCLYPGCSSCTDYSSTCTTTNSSPCLSGYTLSTTLLNCCNPACGDCYGAFSYNCVACSGSNFLLGQICVSVCPIGYTVVGSECYVNVNPFIDLMLDAIEDEVAETAGGIIFGTGADTNFYPNGESSDPIPAMNRGYYFTSTSYMYTPSLTIPYSFTMIFYIKHLTGGSLLSQSSLTISTSGSTTFKISSVITASFSSLPSTDWRVIVFNLSTDLYGTTTASFTSTQDSISSSSTAPNTIFLDTSAPLVLGAPSSSFTGFIYIFQMCIYPETTASLSATMCTSSSQTSCLWNCDITHYLSGTSCTACSNSCTGGCVRSTDCNLCSDLLCSVCSSFTAVCSTCITTAALVANVCVCNNNYYLYSANSCLACAVGTFSVGGAACGGCDASCLACAVSSTTCTSCNANASLVGNSCTCNAGYYFNGNSCAACYATCSACTGPGSSQCSSCISNAVLTVGVCTCGTSYFVMGNTCLACAATCKDCTGALSTQCLDCFSNASIQVDNSCVCNNNYYWSAGACLQCSSNCFTCTVSSSQCTSCTANAILLSSVCTCTGAFIWTGSLCSPCFSTCSTCSGTASNQCLSCENGSALQFGNTCACLNGSYWDSSTLTCQSCDSSCSTCDGPLDSDCLSCSSLATLSNGFCTCPDGYYINLSVCQPCDISCLTCFGPKYYHCLSCLSYYLLGVVCVQTCPIGYFEDMNNCTVMDSPALEFVFDTLGGIFYDSINNVGAITGESESDYPTLDSTDPIPAYQRGIYFTGNGSYLSLPYPSEHILLFGINFSISAWINPFSETGTLFYKAEELLPIFSVTLIDLYLCVSLRIESQSYASQSIYILTEKQWNHVLISVDYSQIPKISFSVNKLLAFATLDTDAPFLDIMGSPMIVGSSSFLPDYFMGFIYSIGIYSVIPSVDSLATFTCDQCAICPISGICLPNCNITTFSLGSSGDCTNCKSECVNGCRNSESCNLCYDKNCYSCSSYDIYNCTKCVQNYKIQNYTCVECSYNEYYSTLLITCEECKGLCVACLSDSYCTVCAENSNFESNHNCYCNKGYSGTSVCIRNTFTAFISINSYNEATISFTEALERNLTTNDILVTIKGTIQTFKIAFIDQATIVICINFTETISNGDELYIKFNSQLISVENSVLDNESLSIQLFPISYNNLSNEENKFKNYAKIGIIIGLSTAFGTSVITFSPLSLFTFLNNAEIYTYMLLYQVQIDTVLIGFLSELQTTSSLPNINSYIFSANSGVQMTGKIKDFGNETNLLLLNSGVSISVLIFLIIASAILYIIKGVNQKWLKEKIAKMRKYLKYGVFSRFWIQTCLDISTNSSFALIYTEFANTTQIIDFCISCFMIVKIT